MPVFPGCQDRNWMLWWPALNSGFAELVQPFRSASACAFTTTVISTVLLKGVKCPVITHVPLTSSRAELNILPGSYSRYYSTFFTQPHQGLLAVLMQLCACLYASGLACGVLMLITHQPLAGRMISAVLSISGFHHNSGHTGGIEPLPPSVIFRCSTSELTVKPELCAPFRGADGSTYDSSTSCVVLCQ